MSFLPKSCGGIPTGFISEEDFQTQKELAAEQTRRRDEELIKNTARGGAKGTKREKVS
jgi:hypothetical protein|tara:strand:+ start:889 stop:1062 length:174 start_codon:yes stop_codon:yes gene_type:complete